MSKLLEISNEELELVIQNTSFNPLLARISYLTIVHKT